MSAAERPALSEHEAQTWTEGYGCPLQQLHDVETVTEKGLLLTHFQGRFRPT